MTGTKLTQALDKPGKSDDWSRELVDKEDMLIFADVGTVTGLITFTGDDAGLPSLHKLVASWSLKTPAATAEVGCGSIAEQGAAGGTPSPDSANC